MYKDVTKTQTNRRKKIFKKGKDKRTFSRSADIAHPANFKAGPMRGGNRL